MENQIAEDIRLRSHDYEFASELKDPTVPPITSRHETADNYYGVIVHLTARHRVVICKDAIQWILQRRKNGDAKRPWRGVGYFRTRDALIRVSATLCGRYHLTPDPLAP